MPTKNKALAKAVLDVIEKDREHWNQNYYASPTDPVRWDDNDWNACGTSHCFGGWAGALRGAKFSPKTKEWRTKSGHRIKNFEGWVAKQLGLTWDEAYSIFYTFTDDFDVLKARVTEVFGL